MAVLHSAFRVLRAGTTVLGALYLMVPAHTALAGAPAALVSAPKTPILRYDAIHHPTPGRAGMVVSQRRVASEVGAQILAAGGNAVDAAVGVGFALAVVLPRAGNLGGGGFMLVYLAEQDRTVAIDYREKAPKAAHRDLFLDADGEVDTGLARFSHRSAGVPGSVAGLTHALERYGTMPLARVIAPAIQLAQEGVVVGYDLASALATRAEVLMRDAATRATFFKLGQMNYEPGDVLVQPELANTLRQIAAGGRQAFYTGEIAHAIVAAMQANDGLITHQDLADYASVEREPLRGTFLGYEIVTMPPPSSGGAHLIQMLNVLEHFPLKKMGLNSSASLHVMAETMKRAYADRSAHMGDMDYYDVPTRWLTSKAYAKELAANIDMKLARPSSEIGPGTPPAYESEDTTHFSVVDRFGNAVANTYTLNFSFGSGITVPGAGFLLNNEMDDFSSKPGVPNAFGLLGGEANAIEPGKRPLSSMTPTMVLRDGRPYLVTGSPGGSRIITAVLQQVVNVLAHEVNVAEATHVPRIHHQWYPDRLYHEPGLNPDTIQALRARGHDLHQANSMGSLQSVLWNGTQYLGASDPRRPGAQAVAVN